MLDRNLKLATRIFACVAISVAALFLPSQAAFAGTTDDPNLVPRIEQFIYRPSPDELIIEREPKVKDKQGVPEDHRKERRKYRKQ